MKLDYIEKRRESHSRYEWTPFEQNDDFTSDWWDDVPYRIDDPWFVQVLFEGVEVARVELDDTVDISHYEGTPQLGPAALEIQLIEVSSKFRRRGVATEVVRGLVAGNPARRLVAFSEEADEFWSSLGWERYDQRESPMSFRPLFVHP